MGGHYGLFAAHEYLKKRTFDPKYNSPYLIRFILGIISGLILGMLEGATDNSGRSRPAASNSR